MRHASLFSGIGGFDLAAEWMGWDNVMQCEIDPFCQHVLRHHFPKATLYEDIRTIDGAKWRGRIDILTGGFPCQPFSASGRRRGEADDRFLWPEMLRIIREVQPAWVVAENVRGLLTLDDGVVLERIRSEMEALGYECQPVLIPACGIGAPHRRERVWFIAHYVGRGRGAGSVREPQDNLRKTGKGFATVATEPVDASAPLADADKRGLKRPGISGKRHIGEEKRYIGGSGQEGSADSIGTGLEGREQTESQGLNGQPDRKQRYERPDWGEDWAKVATRLCRMDDGVSRKLDGIAFSKWRKESLKAYGNAIVPQVAYQIFQSLPLHDRELSR